MDGEELEAGAPDVLTAGKPRVEAYLKRVREGMNFADAMKDFTGELAKVWIAPGSKKKAAARRRRKRKAPGAAAAADASDDETSDEDTEDEGDPPASAALAPENAVAEEDDIIMSDDEDHKADDPRWDRVRAYTQPLLHMQYGSASPAVGKYVVLKAPRDHADSFWVAKVTKCNRREHKMDVVWYAETATAGVYEIEYAASTDGHRTPLKSSEWFHSVVLHSFSLEGGGLPPCIMEYLSTL